MKRSKMLAEIAEVVRDTYLLDYNQVAEAILRKVEDLGMKPPVEEIDPVIFQTKHIWEREDAQN